MRFETLKIFDSAIEAHILKNRLESEGIVCHILDENIVTLDPLLNFAVGGIRLQVSESDFVKAKGVLAEIEATPLRNEQDESIHCPSCSSTQLYSDFKSFKDVKGIVSIIAAFFFTVFPIYSKSVYRCKECNTEFQKT